MFSIMFNTITLILVTIILNLNWIILLGVITRSITEVDRRILLRTEPNGKNRVCYFFDRLKILKCLFYRLIDGAIFVVKFYPLKWPRLICNHFGLGIFHFFIYLVWKYLFPIEFHGPSTNVKLKMNKCKLKMIN